MSVGSYPAGTEAPFPYLTKHKPPNSGTQLRAEKTREWFCDGCAMRVTSASDGSKVYGHARDCPHFDATESGSDGGDA